MHVFLIGICGTGMGSLATLLVDAGHRVSGSDPAPRPPMSEVLSSRGIRVLEGWRPDNVDATRPDLVVVGNVCRRDNPEARRAEELGLERTSMPGAVRSLLLPGRRSLVVAGTHGKTTTAALLASMLCRGGLDPTVLVGGVSLDLGGSSRLGSGPHIVLEGDEYDSAFFEKVPKFWSYEPHAAIIGSVQHDHLDIYPDEESYVRAFEGLAERVDPEGVLLVWASDALALRASRQARCRLLPFALVDDPAPVGPAPAATAAFRVRRGGRHSGELTVRWPDGTRSRLPTPMPGRHNARNALAAALVAREVCGLSAEAVGRGLASFQGVALRQQLIGTRRSVRVYRDFAHHPEAVAETLRAMRPLAEPGRLLAAYEPRSATACRSLHQREYTLALAEADLVVLAPVARAEVPDGERLDTATMARDLRGAGLPATACSSMEQLVGVLAVRARPGDLVLMLSNGHFGGADRLLLERLGGHR